MTGLPSGLIAPNLTPFEHDSSLATDLYVEHSLKLLDQGCGGLAPFGTTGEALSVGIEERMEALDALIRAGVQADRLIVGTGLTNLPDTLRLTRHAMRAGAAAAMVLPPFYFKDPADDGLHRYFESLIDAMDGSVRIVLYHIPQVAGVGLPVPLVSRLKTDFPDQIVGIKDSSGDWSNTTELLAIDGLTVFPGSELPMLEALDLGCDRLISATANHNAEGIIEVLDSWRVGDHERARELHRTAAAVRRTIAEYAPIRAQKRLLAMETGDDRWVNVRPPWMPLDSVRGTRLSEQLSVITGG